MRNQSTTPLHHVTVKSKIYRTLHEAKGFCSRQTLAEVCGVSLPTLYRNLDELMEEGLVRFSGEEQSTGGRKAKGLAIVPDARFSVGVSVNEKTLRLVAADLRMQEIAYRLLPFDVYACLEGRAPKVAAELEDFLNSYHLDRTRLLGVCVTIPGLVSEEESRVYFAPALGAQDFPLRDLLGEIPYPLKVDNDASASGHGECFARRSRESMAYLSLENGVGGAVILGGIPYTGKHSRSGEFGHICVEPGGLRCPCGKLGCLEPYCSQKRFERSFGVSIEDFFRGAAEHRPEYEDLLYDALRHMAVAINSIRMTLDCDVVLGGSLSEYLLPYLPAIRRYVLAGNPFEENADFVQFSILRHHITPLGASLYFIRDFVERV